MVGVTGQQSRSREGSWCWRVGLEVPVLGWVQRAGGGVCWRCLPPFPTSTLVRPEDPPLSLCVRSFPLPCAPSSSPWHRRSLFRCSLSPAVRAPHHSSLLSRSARAATWRSPAVPPSPFSPRQPPPPPGCLWAPVWGCRPHTGGEVSPHSSSHWHLTLLFQGLPGDETMQRPLLSRCRAAESTCQRSTLRVGSLRRTLGVESPGHPAPVTSSSSRESGAAAVGEPSPRPSRSSTTC